MQLFMHGSMAPAQKKEGDARLWTLESVKNFCEIKYKRCFRIADIYIRWLRRAHYSMD